MRNRVHFVLSLLLLNLGGCWILNEKENSNNLGRFYTQTRTVDGPRLPLIKPHEAHKFLKSNSWKIDYSVDSMTESSGGYLFGLQDIDKISIDSVNKAALILKNHSHRFTTLGKDVTKAWYVYEMEKNRIKGFIKKEAYQAYVDSLGYNLPPLKDIDSLWKRFDNGERLYWFPKPGSKEAS